MADLTLPITVETLSEASLSGEGVFDILMQSMKNNLNREFTENRIKGSDYATVYHGILQSTLQASISFLLQAKKNDVEVQILTANLAQVTKQNSLLDAQILQATAQTAVTTQQKLNLVDELLTSTANRTNLASQNLQVQSQTLQIAAQTAMATQQKLNLVDELLTSTANRTNLASQKLQIEAQTAQITAQATVTTQQKLNLVDELLTSTANRTNLGSQNLQIQGQTLQIAAQTAMSTQQKLNLVDDLLTATSNRTNLTSQNAQIVAGTANLVQKTANAVIEGTVSTAQKLQITQQTALALAQTTSEAFRSYVSPDLTLLGAKDGTLEKERQVLIATKCKLDAEFDILVLNKLQTTAQTTLLNQKTATEKAQITTLGVDTDSVVGRQKELYLAQSNGFKRDAEQKATKLLVDTWTVRKTTDATATDHNVTNHLDDATIGRVVSQMVTGVGTTVG